MLRWARDVEHGGTSAMKSMMRMARPQVGAAERDQVAERGVVECRRSPLPRVCRLRRSRPPLASGIRSQSLPPAALLHSRRWWGQPNFPLPRVPAISGPVSHPPQYSQRAVPAPGIPAHPSSAPVRPSCDASSKTRPQDASQPGLRPRQPAPASGPPPPATGPVPAHPPASGIRPRERSEPFDFSSISANFVSGLVRSSNGYDPQKLGMRT